MATETPIRAPFLETTDPTLRLQLGACRLRITRGGTDAWMDGAYHDPGGDDPIRLHVDGDRVTLSQVRPVDRAVGLLQGVPTCELALGTQRSFRLQIDTGGSDVDLDLGGIPLRGLALRAGAGKVDVRVETPNPVDADEITVHLGAGGLDARGLGNLAARRLRVDSGAANVSLDLTGELRRHLDVEASAGLSSVRIVVPHDRPVRIAATTTLGGRDLGDGFVTHDGAVLTTVDGDPVIDLTATVALGNLVLRTD